MIVSAVTLQPAGGSSVPLLELFTVHLEIQSDVDVLRSWNVVKAGEVVLSAAVLVWGCFGGSMQCGDILGML